VYIPREKLILIRDREKGPTEGEIEHILMQQQSLLDKVAHEEAILAEKLAQDITEFGGDIPIDPAVLAMEEAFRVKQNPLSRIRIGSDDEEEVEDDYIPLSPLGRMHIDRNSIGAGDEDDDVEMCSSPLISFATIDSFDQRNQDFLRFQ
jgi:hypothetical protein